MSPDPIEFFRRLGTASVRRALRDVPAGRKMGATVTAYTANISGNDNFGRTVARVRLDGTSKDVPAMVVVGQDLYPGQRVMVEWNPPHQFLVTGIIPLGSAGMCQVLHVPIGGGSWDDGETISFDLTDEAVVNCGWGLFSDDTLSFPVSGTWAVAASVRVGFEGALLLAETLSIALVYSDGTTDVTVASGTMLIPAGVVSPTVTLNTGNPIIYGGIGDTLVVTASAVNAGWTSDGDSIFGVSAHKLCCVDVNVFEGGGEG